MNPTTPLARRGARRMNRAAPRRPFLTLDRFNPDIADVSMVQLIATPERFHGKRVRFTGFVHFQFEGNGISPHKEDFDHGIVDDAVWIDAPSGSKLNDAYVLVEGTLRADARGHMVLFSGTLADVARMDLLAGFTGDTSREDVGAWLRRAARELGVRLPTREESQWIVDTR